MKKVIGGFLIFVFIFMAFQVSRWHHQSIERICAQKIMLQQEIRHYKLIREIIRRESSGSHYGVWGDNGTSYGLCQFKQKTFRYYADKVYKMPWLVWQNPRDQVELMDRMIRDGYGPREWSTYEDAERTVVMAEYAQARCNYRTGAPK